MSTTQISFIQKYFTVFESTWKKIIKMILIFNVSAVLDVLSIGLIAPFVTMATKLSVNPDGVLAKFFYTITGRDLSSDPQLFVRYTGSLLVCIFIVKGIVAYRLQYIISRTSLEEALSLRLRLMRAYMDMPYSYFLSKNSSEIVQSMVLHSTNFINGVLLSSFRVASEIFTAFVIVALLAYKEPVAVVISVVALVTFVVVYTLLIKKKVYFYGRSTNIATLDLIRDLTQFVKGFKDIKVLGLNPYFAGRIQKSADIISTDGAKHSALILTPKYIIETIVFTVIVFCVIGIVTAGGDLAQYYPVLSMFALAAVRLIPSATYTINGLAQIRNNTYSLDLIHAILAQHREYITNDRKHPVTQAIQNFNSLKVQNVSYRYEDQRTPALNGVSFELSFGRSIGLIGKSGSGKTTLVDVVLGLLTPESGQVLVNDKPLRDCLSSWREKVAYIPQMIFLMDDTLKRNIALGQADNEIDDRRLNSAITDSALAEVVSSLPQGVDTQVGESGIKLSGGQRQRVALARAFYFQKEVIIMDEATSALDHETEKTIIEAIHQLQGKKTLIVIAHRLSTIQDCDSLVELSNGEIIKQGRPADVLH